MWPQFGSSNPPSNVNPFTLAAQSQPQAGNPPQFTFGGDVNTSFSFNFGDPFAAPDPNPLPLGSFNTSFGDPFGAPVQKSLPAGGFNTSFPAFVPLNPAPSFAPATTSSWDFTGIILAPTSAASVSPERPKFAAFNPLPPAQSESAPLPTPTKSADRPARLVRQPCVPMRREAWLRKLRETPSVYSRLPRFRTAETQDEAMGAQCAAVIDIWTPFLCLVLRKVHRGYYLSTKAAELVNVKIQQVFEGVCAYAAIVAHKFKRSPGRTIDSRDIQTGIRHFFAEALAKHAISEGTNAVTKYYSKYGGARPRGSQSMSAAAGLQLSVEVTLRLLHEAGYAPRYGVTAAVYLTAVLEYIAAEILQLSGNAARKNAGDELIRPEHVRWAIEFDEELNDQLGARHITGLAGKEKVRIQPVPLAAA